VTFISAGVCTITANQTGDGTYAPAAPVTRSFTIDQASQTLTFAQPGAQLVNSGPLVLAPSASSGLTATLSSSTPTVCTVSGTTVTFVSFGLCTVTADQSGNGSYAAATPISRSFAINQVAQTITFGQPSAQLVNAGPLVLTPTATSGLTPVLTSSTTGVCTVSGMTVAFVSAGLCTIDANQSGDATYSAAPPVSRSFAINQVIQTITFNPPADQSMVDGSLVLSPTASSGLTPLLSSSTPTFCTVSGMTVTFVSAGVCTITANQAGSATYAAAAPVSHSFDIDQAAQTITFVQPADVLMNGGPFALAPTASSGLVPVLSSTTPGVCTVSGFAVTLVGAGTCTIQANQSGDASYTAATPVTRSFTVNQVAQLITFAQPVDQVLADASLTVGPTADSGLVTALSSGTTGVCTVSGMTITFVTTGLCTVTADQAGNATFAAAAPVSRSFGIGFLSQTITFAQPTDVSLDDPSVVLSISADSGLTPTLVSNTTAVCTVSGMTVAFVSPGLCTVTASQVGNTTYAAAAPISRSFQVVEIDTDTIDPMRAGTPFSQQLTVLGAAGGGVWSTTAPLPSGLVLDAATGMLTGTPTGPLSQLMTFAYTENGVVHDATLLLSIAAALSPLAFTGTDAMGPLAIALLLVVLGGVALVIGLRRRRRTAR
jgi:hypothetical protein